MAVTLLQVASAEVSPVPTPTPIIAQSGVASYPLTTAGSSSDIGSSSDRKEQDLKATHEKSAKSTKSKVHLSCFKLQHLSVGCTANMRHDSWATIPQVPGVTVTSACVAESAAYPMLPMCFLMDVPAHVACHGQQSHRFAIELMTSILIMKHAAQESACCWC